MEKLIQSINPENNKLTQKELDSLYKLKKEPNSSFDKLSADDKASLKQKLDTELKNYSDRKNVNERSKNYVSNLIMSILSKFWNVSISSPEWTVSKKVDTKPSVSESKQEKPVIESEKKLEISSSPEIPVKPEKKSEDIKIQDEWWKNKSSQFKPIPNAEGKKVNEKTELIWKTYTQPNNVEKSIEWDLINLNNLNNKLESKKVLVDWIPFREERFWKIWLWTSYITWEYALALINNWKILEAEKVLKWAVESAKKNNWRLPRLYYADWNWDGLHATNWDVSDISIALWRYINATQNDTSNDFRNKAIEANQLLQKWLNWESGIWHWFNWLEKVWPKVKDSNWSDQNAFRVMSDDNTPFTVNEDWVIKTIETHWKTSISVENESRRLMSVFLSGDKVLAKNSLQTLIDSSWMGEEKWYFSSWIDYNSFKWIDWEVARDALSLMIMAADMMWILDWKNRDKFVKAATKKPWYSLDDETFGFPYDANPNKISKIPEFMYIDVGAMRLLWLNDIAEKYLKLWDKAQEELWWIYSTEYFKLAGFNPIWDIMRFNITNRLNYYSGKKSIK